MNKVTLVNKTNSSTLNLDVNQIKEMTREHLLNLWKTAYRKDPPKGISRRTLEQASAYYLQTKKHGGLSRAITLKLTRTHQSSNNTEKGNALAEGTILIREWHGVSHRVVVMNSRYLWRDKTYKSLSEIARTITGTRWSGPRFFGLRT